jgi:hypothetical protein
LTDNCEHERAQHEQSGKDRRGLRQERRPASGAERGLTARAAKCGSHIAFALLQKDDHQQQETDDNVKRRE